MRAFLTISVLTLWVASALPAAGQEPGYVLQVQGRLVFIDKGMQDNIQPDDLFEVVRQETIIHPVTGENLGGRVHLGAVRVIEVFSRLSTAEVVDLVKGMGPEVLDQEAKQGLIRVQPLPTDMETAIKARMKAIEDKASGMTGKRNPDGVIGHLVPDFRFGLGSRTALPLPGRVDLLIADTLRFGHLAGRPVASLPEGAYVSVADSLLIDFADTAGVGPLPAFGPAEEVGVSLLFPVTTWSSAIADLGFGSRSRILLGTRVYPGALFGFLGKGVTPDGRVGEPVLTVKVGWGGEGPRSLPASAETQLVARQDLQPDSLFISTLAPEQASAADSLYRTGITEILRHEATDSLQQISERKFGFALGLSLPLARHFTLRAGLTQLGNIHEVTAGLTYFVKGVDKDGMVANPDGAVRSPILSLDWIYDSDSKEGFLNPRLKFPLSRNYTLAAGYVTDLGSFNRFGITLRGYLQGF